MSSSLMGRIGYEADTRFRNRDDSVWQSAEGAEFGEMTRGVEQSFSFVCVFWTCRQSTDYLQLYRHRQGRRRCPWHHQRRPPTTIHWTRENRLRVHSKISVADTDSDSYSPVPRLIVRE